MILQVKIGQNRRFSVFFPLSRAPSRTPPHSAHPRVSNPSRARTQIPGRASSFRQIALFPPTARAGNPVNTGNSDFRRQVRGGTSPPRPPCGLRRPWSVSTKGGETRGRGAAAASRRILHLQIEKTKGNAGRRTRHVGGKRAFSRRIMGRLGSAVRRPPPRDVGGEKRWG